MKAIRSQAVALATLAVAVGLVVLAWAFTPSPGRWTGSAFERHLLECPRCADPDTPRGACPVMRAMMNRPAPGVRRAPDPDDLPTAGGPAVPPTAAREAAP